MKHSEPMPRCAAYLMVSNCEHATHSGGCGFCSGFGTTARNGNLKNSPSYSQPWFQNIGSVQRTASSQTSRLSRKRRLKGCSSVTDAPSPRPNSTRPSETRSSVAIFSATRAGWLVVICTMPWPKRMFLVR